MSRNDINEGIPQVQIAANNNTCHLLNDVVGVAVGVDVGVGTMVENKNDMRQGDRETNGIKYKRQINFFIIVIDEQMSNNYCL